MTDRPTAPTDRPGLRPAAPERASANGHQPDQTNTTDPTPSRLARLLDRIRPTDRKESTMPTLPTLTVAPAPTDSAKPSRVSRWRRKPTAAAVDPTIVGRAAAIHAKPTGAKPTDRTAAQTDIAPVPHAIKWAGVWLDRTFGAMPLLAPLVVSGFFTMQVFTDQPIDAHWAIALAATVALEGGVWKLSRLYEKTLVAGDSTMALRAGIAGYLALISGLIYWHADHQAQVNGQTELGYDALPAFGVAVMSALGVFIWSRTARWQRRRELHDAGRVDTQAPKFAALAWILCPLETPQALRHAVKYRIPSPVDAVEDLRLYKASGRPSVWPPLVHTDPTAEATRRPDRPTFEATRPAPVAQPRPTVSAPVTQSSAPTAASRPTVAAAPTPTKPTVPSLADSKPTDQTTFTPAAIQNAATIRARYGTLTDLRLSTVRGDTGWSFDRANPALKAYHARADQPTDDLEAETGDRPFADAR